jgi:four helix bundle protein
VKPHILSVRDITVRQDHLTVESPLRRLMIVETEALKRRTKDFALRILRLYRTLPRTQEARIVGTQLLRSGTSIGANYRAACRGRSRAEFIAKLGIVVEEADETLFWLELLQEANIFPTEKLNYLAGEANELVAIFSSSVRTARGLAQ